MPTDARDEKQDEILCLVLHKAVPMQPRREPLLWISEIMSFFT